VYECPHSTHERPIRNSRRHLARAASLDRLLDTEGSDQTPFFGHLHFRIEGFYSGYIAKNTMKIAPAAASAAQTDSR
jgi:hypothetical protein